jgi:hypothetical protein
VKFFQDPGEQTHWQGRKDIKEGRISKKEGRKKGRISKKEGSKKEY